MATVWNDPDFIAMPATAQRMFMFLLSQADLSHAGLIPMRANRWARKASDTTPKSIRADLARLGDDGFIVLDDETEEVLIRTMVRNDGVYKQPKVMLRMREDAQQIESPLLRAAFRAELDRLPLHELSTNPTGRDGDGPSTRASVEGVVDTLRDDFADVVEYPTRYPSEGVSDTPRVRAGALPLPPAPYPQPPAPVHFVSATDVADAPTEAAESKSDRQDVERICNALADEIEANGSKRPNVTKGWRDAARLMLDKDGRTEAEILGAIAWCQADEFWRANVLSLPKLREKYDQLRLQAQRKQQPQGRRQAETNDLFDAAMQRALTKEGITHADDRTGSRGALPIHQSVLPPAGD